MTKLAFPLTVELLEALKIEYKIEAKDKGNSWLDMKLGDLIIEFQEEYDECQELLNDGKIGNELLEELKDLMLVSFMLYQVSKHYMEGSYKE